MTPVELVAASAVAAAGYAIWVRRHTLASSAERPLTLSVILCVVGFALISPQSSGVIGSFGHALTGIWHLDTCAGDLCLLASQVCALSALLGGVFTDADRADWMRIWVQPIVTVVVPGMTTCIILTHALRTETPNILDARPDGWLAGYWLLLVSTTAYLWLAGLRVLRVLRADRRSRRVANAYIVAMSCGVAGGALLMVWVLTGAEPLGHGLITWLLVGSAYAGTCLAAAWSWRLKEQRLRGDRPALGI